MRIGRILQNVARSAVVLGLTVLALSLGLMPTQVSQAQGPYIVINEIMQNPSAVSDTNGEWFELYNAGTSAVDIDGWTIRDDGSDSHVINNGGPLTIPAGGFLVLGRDANSGTNGGVNVDYQYSSFILANGADEVILEDDSPTPVEIDRVEYDGGPNFPDPNGASMYLVNPGFDNNVGSNWSTSTTAWPGSDGDYGSPGDDNEGVDPTAVDIATLEATPGGLPSVALPMGLGLTAVLVGGVFVVRRRKQT